MIIIHIKENFKNIKIKNNEKKLYKNKNEKNKHLYNYKYMYEGFLFKLFLYTSINLFIFNIML